MQTIIHLGASPTEENCAQFGSASYDEKSQIECLVFKRMLTRTSPPPAGADLIVKTFPYGSGHYREVCVRFDEHNERACAYALQLEATGPTKWDAIAAFELAWFERRSAYLRALRTSEVSDSDIPAQYTRAEPPAEIYALPTPSASDLFSRFPI